MCEEVFTNGRAVLECETSTARSMENTNEIADITTPTNHIPHGISTQGGKITSVTTPVSFSKTTSKNAESSTLISATSTLTSDGPTISHITSSTTHLASTTILSSTKPTDENDNKVDEAYGLAVTAFAVIVTAAVVWGVRILWQRFKCAWKPPLARRGADHAGIELERMERGRPRRPPVGAMEEDEEDVEEPRRYNLRK